VRHRLARFAAEGLAAPPDLAGGLITADALHY
jgi:hypothetical protein